MTIKNSRSFKTELRVPRGQGQGLKKVLDFLIIRIKSTLNVAPKRVNGVVTPATAGSAPRKITGGLREAVKGIMISDHVAYIVIDLTPSKFNYGRYHEKKIGGYVASGKHRYIQPTIDLYRREIRVMLGKDPTDKRKWVQLAVREF